MSKKSKITVKRYFNTKVNGISVYRDLEEKGHPLYYSITYKRKTQRIKSFRGAVMTKKAFDYLEENNKALDYETNYLPNAHTNSVSLEKELSFIYKAVEYIVYNENYEDIFDDEFTDRLRRFFSNLQESLYYIGWNKYKHFIEPVDEIKPNKNKSSFSVSDIENYNFDFNKQEKALDKKYKNLNDPKYLQQQFYYSLNQDRNLIVNLKHIQDVLEIDLKPYVYSDTLKMWYIINLVNLAYPRTVCIDFIINYNENEIIKIAKQQKYPITEKEIKIACKILKNKILMFL